MMRSLFSGVAGLRNHQIKMDVIGDNISNVNTLGFKKSRVNFQDLLVQTMRGATAPQGGRGGVNPMQVGLGMGLGNIDVVNTQGNLQNTGKTTDLAIDGDGFFIVGDGSNRAYTRTGTLDVDKNGDLIMASNGLKVMGWQADNDGIVQSTGPIGNLNIPVGAAIPAKATKEILFSKNLDVSTEVNGTIITSSTVYDSLGAAHSVEIAYSKPMDTSAVQIIGAILDNTGTGAGTRTKPQNIFVGDNNGVLRALQVVIETNVNTAGSETFNFHIYENGAELVGAVANPVTITDMKNGFPVSFTSGTTGTVDFTLSYPSATLGTYKEGTSKVISNELAGANIWYWAASTTDSSISRIENPIYDPSLAAPPIGNRIEFSNSGEYQKGGGNIALAFNNGATVSSVKIDLTSLTQYAKDTTVTGAADGYTSGSLQSISLDSSGIITGAFSNGITQSIGQVALAVFSNPGGLIRQGGSLYRESNNSGTAQIGTSGNGGRGKMTPGALEMANVDLAQEFTDMIITQRGFQANSKIITTTDEMLDLLANLKR